MVLNYLKIGPLRNSSFCFLCISTSLRSANIDIPNKQNTTHSITTNPLVLNGLQIIKLNHDFWNTLFFKTPATFGPHFSPLGFAVARNWCCSNITLYFAFLSLWNSQYFKPKLLPNKNWNSISPTLNGLEPREQNTQTLLSSAFINLIYFDFARNKL